MKMYVAIIVGLALIPGIVTADTPTTEQEASKSAAEGANAIYDMNQTDGTAWLASCIIVRAAAVNLRGDCVTAGATTTDLDPGDGYIISGDYDRILALAPEVDAYFHYGDAAAMLSSRYTLEFWRTRLCSGGHVLR